jgi:hypothetical protein
MVIVREIGIAVFDSTAPHEYEPERIGDMILDMYEAAIAPGTDEKYADEIEDVRARYSTKMKEAISYLSEAKNFHDQLEAIYVKAMDFDKINAIYLKIDKEIEILSQ